MAMFVVMLRRSGPEWDPSRPLEQQSEWDAHAREPWSETHLLVETIDPWTIRLDGRRH